MIDDENLQQLEDGMRQIGEYARRIAREGGVGEVDLRWSYVGDLRNGPEKFTLTISHGNRSQDAIFPREPVEDYPGQAGVGKTEAVVKEAVRRLKPPKPSR
jgi:hypothetical protein